MGVLHVGSVSTSLDPKTLLGELEEDDRGEDSKSGHHPHHDDSHPDGEDDHVGSIGARPVVIHVPSLHSSPHGFTSLHLSEEVVFGVLESLTKGIKKFCKVRNFDKFK